MAKQRNGPNGTVKVRFMKEYGDLGRYKIITFISELLRG